MIAGLVLAAGMLGSTSSEAAIQTFGQACLAQAPATREGLAALAASQHWDFGRPEVPEDLEWRVVYRAGKMIVRLDQHRVSNNSSGERICVVFVGPAPTDWKAQVSALQVNGVPVGAPGEYDGAVYQLPDGIGLTVWDTPAAGRIHALTTPDGQLELSINYPTAN